MDPSRKLPTVLVYSTNLLPYSETFIKSQMLAMETWRPILVGERILPDGLSLEGLELKTLLPTGAKSWQRFTLRMSKRMGRALPVVVRRLRALDADLIHAHFGPSAVEIWPYAKKLGLPLLVTLHGYDINVNRSWWESGRGGKQMREYPDRLLQLSHDSNVQFLAVSKAIAERAVEYGVPKEKIRIHYIGVDITLFATGRASPHTRAKRVLFVGRMVEKKGASYLLRAFAHVRERIPDAELVLAGDGPLRQALQRQAEELGVAAHFLGAQTPEQIRELMARSRVLCLPSVTAENGDAEGLGLVLLEAQAAGVPVVSSARGGADEAILHGFTGFRHEEGDVRALEDHILRILSDDKLFERLATQGADYVARQFDLGLQTAKLSAIYKECVNALKNENKKIS